MKSILITLLLLFLMADKPEKVIIEQQLGTNSPRIYYNNIKDRIECVCFPIRITVENATDTEAAILMIDHRGISGYGEFKRFGWRSIVLFEDRGDTLIGVDSQQGIEYIYPDTKMHYKIETEYLVYDDTVFQGLFKSEMKKMKINDEKFENVNLDVLTSGQLDYLRGMLSKDSIKIILAHNESRYRIFFPIDVDKVIPLKINH